jgi:hypothetical protein
MLRVGYVRGDLPLDRGSFRVLVDSSGVLGAAVRAVPGLTPEMLAEDISATLSEVSELQQVEGHMLVTTALLQLSVRVERSVADADAKAGRLLAALSKRLEQVLVERNEGTLSRRREDLARAAEQVTQAEQQLGQVQELQQKLYAEAGQSELSRTAILADLQGAEQELQHVGMKLASLHARQNATAEQIARIGKEIAARAQEDPVAVELQKIVELREQALKKEKETKEAGMFSGTAGEEAVALARAELAKQRQAAAQAAGGNLLAELNKEVVTLAVDIAEAEARGEYFHTRLALARDKKLLELADHYEREVAPQLGAAEQAVRQALQRRAEAEEQLAQYRPVTVTVMGGAEDK